jgi:hypothetical protein
MESALIAILCSEFGTETTATPGWDTTTGILFSQVQVSML